MAIDPQITIAQAWADDRARLESIKTALEEFKASVDVEIDLYIDTRALNAARHAVGEVAMRIENIDSAIAHLDELLA